MLPLPRVPSARRWRREHRAARFARAQLAGWRKARRGWPPRPSGCPSPSWAGYRMPRSWPWNRSPPSSAGCLRQPFSTGPGQRRRPRQAGQPPRRRARRSGRRHRARPVDGRPPALGWPHRRAVSWRRAWGRDRFPLPSNSSRGSRSPMSRDH